MKKNEQGYSLIIILLTITIILILSASIIGIILNTSLQTKKSEERIQLNHISEMGILYYRNLIESIVPTLSKEKPEALSQLQNNLPSLSSPLVKNLPSTKGSYQYSVGYKIISINEKAIRIEYISKAIVNDDVLENTETILLQLNENNSNEFDFTQLNLTNPSEQYVSYNNIKDIETIDGNANFIDTVSTHPTGKLFVNGNVVINDGLEMANDGLMKVDGYFYFKGRKLLINQGSTLEITKDARFDNLDEQDIRQIKNESRICVHGSLQGSIPQEDIIFTNECPSNGNGIYVLNKNNSENNGSGDWEIIGSISN